MIRAYDDNGNVVDLVAWEKQIRAEAIEEALQIIHNIYTQDLYCIAECTRDIAEYNCEDCLYKSIKQNLEQLKENANE